jgi:hypothetical protein
MIIHEENVEDVHVQAIEHGVEIRTALGHMRMSVHRLQLS